jgi:hypothetical protein
MTQLSTIIILAITLEALIEYVKLIVVDKKIVWKQIVSIALGVALSCTSQVNLFDGRVEFITPWIGIVLTGVIFSRGSNYVADFLKRISGSNDSVEGE